MRYTRPKQEVQLLEPSGAAAGVGHDRARFPGTYGGNPAGLMPVLGQSSGLGTEPMQGTRQDQIKPGTGLAAVSGSGQDASDTDLRVGMQTFAPSYKEYGHANATRHAPRESEYFSTFVKEERSVERGGAMRTPEQRSQFEINAPEATGAEGTTYFEDDVLNVHKDVVSSDHAAKDSTVLTDSMARSGLTADRDTRVHPGSTATAGGDGNPTEGVAIVSIKSPARREAPARRSMRLNRGTGDKPIPETPPDDVTPVSHTNHQVKDEREPDGTRPLETSSSVKTRSRRFENLKMTSESKTTEVPHRDNRSRRGGKLSARKRVAQVPDNKSKRGKESGASTPSTTRVGRTRQASASREVLRLQKSIATASWTNSIDVDRLDAPMLSLPSGVSRRFPDVRSTRLHVRTRYVQESGSEDEKSDGSTTQRRRRKLFSSPTQSVRRTRSASNSSRTGADGARRNSTDSAPSSLDPRSRSTKRARPYAHAADALAAFEAEIAAPHKEGAAKRRRLRSLHRQSSDGGSSADDEPDVSNARRSATVGPVKADDHSINRGGDHAGHSSETDAIGSAKKDELKDSSVHDQGTTRRLSTELDRKRASRKRISYKARMHAIRKHASDPPHRVTASLVDKQEKSCSVNNVLEEHKGETKRTSPVRDSSAATTAPGLRSSRVATNAHRPRRILDGEESEESDPTESDEGCDTVRALSERGRSMAVSSSAEPSDSTPLRSGNAVPETAKIVRDSEHAIVKSRTRRETPLEAASLSPQDSSAPRQTEGAKADPTLPHKGTGKARNPGRMKPESITPLSPSRPRASSTPSDEQAQQCENADKPKAGAVESPVHAEKNFSSSAMEELAPSTSLLDKVTATPVAPAPRRTRGRTRR